MGKHNLRAGPAAVGPAGRDRRVLRPDRRHQEVEEVVQPGRADDPPVQGQAHGAAKGGRDGLVRGDVHCQGRHRLVLGQAVWRPGAVPGLQPAGQHREAAGGRPVRKGQGRQGRQGGWATVLSGARGAWSGTRVLLRWRLLGKGTAGGRRSRGRLAQNITRSVDASPRSSLADAGGRRSPLSAHASPSLPSPLPLRLHAGAQPPRLRTRFSGEASGSGCGRTCLLASRGASGCNGSWRGGGPWGAGWCWGMGDR